MVALVATLLFVSQGGLGAGHLDYDFALGLLGFPWMLLPWPKPVYQLGDYVWLIAIPFALDLICVWGLVRLIDARRLSPRTRQLH